MVYEDMIRRPLHGTHLYCMSRACRVRYEGTLNAEAFDKAL